MNSCECQQEGGSEGNAGTSGIFTSLVGTLSKASCRMCPDLAVSCRPHGTDAAERLLGPRQRSHHHQRGCVCRQLKYKDKSGVLG